MLVKTSLVAVFFLLCDGIIFTNAEPTWTSLRVTWGLNLFSSRVFAKLPRRESKATTEGWTRLPGECSGGKFIGNRYIKSGDVSTILIYDTNGFVAGMQHGIMEKDTINRTSVVHLYSISPAYQLDKVDEEDVYFLTVYFVDPSIICHEGRTQEQYDDEGTGNALYFQNGTNPLRDSFHVAMYEEGMDGTKWVKGGCYPSIGLHYWHEVSENMNCDHFFPISVVYNRGKITSFAFVTFGPYYFTERFEHPQQSTFERYLPTPPPQCVKDEYDASGGFSVMHVFFSIRPWNILC